jgi:hypothetical protein
VLKLDANGNYQWHTFYGSSSYDFGNSIDVDSDGNIYVTGSGYKTWNGPDDQIPLNAYSDGYDLFVVKLTE